MPEFTGMSHHADSDGRLVAISVSRDGKMSVEIAQDIDKTDMIALLSDVIEAITDVQRRYTLIGNISDA